LVILDGLKQGQDGTPGPHDFKPPFTSMPTKSLLIIVESRDALQSSPTPNSNQNICTRSDLLNDYPILEPFTSAHFHGIRTPVTVAEMKAVKRLVVSKGEIRVQVGHVAVAGCFKASKTNLLMSGFIIGEVTEDSILTVNPSFETGPAQAIPKKSTNEEDVDLVDEDDLLTAEDRTKPSPTLDCGPSTTTTAKKACKNCSCGLSDLESQQKSTITIDTSAAAKSSCGNCSLGDAFRCGGCPYRGMPAFKPGEQVQIPDDLLQDDF